MKGIKGKLLKKMKDRVLQVSDSNGFVLNSWRGRLAYVEKTEKEPGVEEEEEEEGASFNGNLGDKENVVPPMAEKRSSFLMSKGKRGLRGIGNCPEIDVSPVRKVDFADGEKAELVTEVEVSGREDGEPGVPEFDVSSFRKPDMNSYSLFDPKLLALFYRAVAERRSRIELDDEPPSNYPRIEHNGGIAQANPQNPKEEEEEEEVEELPSVAPRVEHNGEEEESDDVKLPPSKYPRIEHHGGNGQASPRNPKEEEGEELLSVATRVEHNGEDEESDNVKFPPCRNVIEDSNLPKSIEEEELPSKALPIEHNEEEGELSEENYQRNPSEEEDPPMKAPRLEHTGDVNDDDSSLEFSKKSSPRQKRIEEANFIDADEFPPSKASLIEQTEEDGNKLLEFTENCPPGGSESVILYTTTLRGIRKTFEGCRSLRFLLESFHVIYSERDVSMHADFRDELRRVLGGAALPPKLFVKGRFIGGTEEVLGLHERGELRPLFDGVPVIVSDCPCEGCGGIRFLVCFSCHGSRKVLGEDDRKGTCRKCNENGLILCPLCS